MKNPVVKGTRKCLIRKCLQILTYLFIFDDFIMIIYAARCNDSIYSVLKDMAIFTIRQFHLFFYLLFFVKTFRKNVKILSFRWSFQPNTSRVKDVARFERNQNKVNHVLLYPVTSIFFVV